MEGQSPVAVPATELGHTEATPARTTSSSDGEAVAPSFPAYLTAKVGVSEFVAPTGCIQRFPPRSILGSQYHPPSATHSAEAQARRGAQVHAQGQRWPPLKPDQKGGQGQGAPQALCRRPQKAGGRVRLFCQGATRRKGRNRPGFSSALELGQLLTPTCPCTPRQSVTSGSTGGAGALKEAAAKWKELSDEEKKVRMN